MAGRGTRLSPDTGKTDCLILDYGGNIMRHGPLDMIKAKEPGKGGGGDAPAKTCPECHAIIHAGYGTCPECGYEFPPPERSNLTGHASSEGVLSGEVRESTMTCITCTTSRTSSGTPSPERPGRCVWTTRSRRRSTSPSGSAPNTRDMRGASSSGGGASAPAPTARPEHRGRGCRLG